MNMKKMKRMISVLALILAAALTMTGCSGGGDQKTANRSVAVAVLAPYVLDGALPEFEAQLRAGLPGLNTEESQMLIQAVSTGDTKADPMSAMAGMTKVTTMMIDKQIEIMICDADNAQRYSEGGAAYLPLDELFTAEEQNDLGVIALTVSAVDKDGNLTGDQSAPCGISLENCEGLINIFKMSDLGLYVFVTSPDMPNIENIRTAVRYILNM